MKLKLFIIVLLILQINLQTNRVNAQNAQMDTQTNTQQTLEDEDFDLFNANIMQSGIPLFTPFSYHIIKKTSKLHLHHFIDHLTDAGFSVEFLNEVEYANIIHALGMTRGEILLNGTSLLASMITLDPMMILLALSSLLAQDQQIAHQRITNLYFLDVVLTESGMINAFILVFQLSNGREHLVTFICDQQCNSRMQNTGADDLLRNYMSEYLPQGLLQSFNEALEREFPPNNFFMNLFHRALGGNSSSDYRFTLYLKDLSETQKIVRRYKDVERINIGVIVETINDKGQREFVKEFDWILPTLRLEHTAGSIQQSITIPFHESAHALMLLLLDGPQQQSDLNLLIYPHLVPSLKQNQNNSLIDWKFLDGRVNHNELEIHYFDRIIINIAGIVVDGLHDFHYISEAYDGDMAQARLNAFEYLCPRYSFIEKKDDCPPSPNTLSTFSTWKDQSLSENDNEPFVLEMELLLKQAKRLALMLLYENFPVLQQLIRLVLQKNMLKPEDFQRFYQMYLSDIDQQELGLTSTRPLGRPLLANDFFSAIQLAPDILNRNLSMLFSLNPQDHFERVRGLSIQEILAEAQKVQISPQFLHLIRRDKIPYAQLQPTYSQGLQPLYVQENINLLLSFIR